MKVEHQVGIGTRFAFPIDELDEAIIVLSATIDFFKASGFDTSEAEQVLLVLQQEYRMHSLH